MGHGVHDVQLGLASPEPLESSRHGAVVFDLQNIKAHPCAGIWRQVCPGCFGARKNLTRTATPARDRKHKVCLSFFGISTQKLDLP